MDDKNLRLSRESRGNFVPQAGEAIIFCHMIWVIATNRPAPDCRSSAAFPQLALPNFIG
jgi:hypothetical protein